VNWGNADTQSCPTTHPAKTMPPSQAKHATMTIGQAVNYRKVTERIIYRLAGAKQIPALKVGGSWRFSKAIIADWIRRQSSTGFMEG
jgi:excisionase family DNA binding protein